ncbi:MAG: hypothetical protein D6698_00065 [Gammaproteobacteria bacterium]|nr:MAG: hypothetical protein D6698_00065 [Gammaproteobacteria bacterium]
MQTYRAFLLSCWQEETAVSSPQKWRFRLEEPRTGEQHGFTSLAEVMAFVQARLKEAGGDEGNGRSSTP